MSRARPRAAGPSVSLFPFLAVLLCTMGVLIVVLVVLVEHGRGQGEQAKRLAEESAQEELQFQQWKVQQLHAALKSAREDLEKANRDLALIDAEVLAAEKDFASLEDRAKRIEDVKASPDVNIEALKKELESLEAQLAQAKEKAEEPAPSQIKRRYAVVPYLGRHSTFRPPVYIECRADRIIIQPENIVLLDSDFQGSLGPTNALATVLRATREYVRSEGGQQNAENSFKEPYPLLLVRPDGIGAFYVAREALKSFGGQFGYELVEADWEIKFPKPDEKLAAAQKVALADARDRNQILAQAAPSMYGNPEEAVFQAAVGEEPQDRPTYTPDSGALAAAAEGSPAAHGWGLGENTSPLSASPLTAPSSSGSAEANRVLAGAANTSAAAASTANSGGSETDNATGAGNALADGEQAGEGGWKDGSSNLLADERGGQGGGGQEWGEAGSSADPYGQPQGTASFASGDLSARRQTSAAPQGTSVAAASADGQAAGTAERDALGNSNQDNAADASHERALAQSPTGNGERIGNRGEAQPSDSGSRSPSSSSVASNSGASSSGPQSSAAGEQLAAGDDSPHVTQQVQASAAPPPIAEKQKRKSELDERCLARKLGRDWALPKAARSAVAVTRPITVRCTAQGLQLVSASGAHRPFIPWRNPIDETAKELVDQAWNETQAWGAAGQGMHWRPQLSADVQPGGESKYRELVAALQSSGLETKRTGAAPFFVRRTEATRNR